MATLKSRWFLSILLLNLPDCLALAGPPALPSPPECYIPCDERICGDDIYCTWDSRPEPQIPTNYSLRWEPTNSDKDYEITGTSLSGFIYREHFSSYVELRVWVQAENQNGSVKSKEAVFNTANINKPQPPKIRSSYPESLDIFWISSCDQLGFSVGRCNIRHRTAADQVWLEDECGIYGSYTYDRPQPCTAYEFQVRCACDTGLTSDWSAILRIQGKETTPVGELDVWIDCGIPPASADCVLTWKKLPLSQACGLILGYEVTLSYNNGTVVSVNVSTAETGNQSVYNEMPWRFNHSLKNVLSVNVSAYNAHGATVPSYLAMPLPGKEKNEPTVHLKMNEENLAVSWNLPSQLFDNLREYVVQYKQLECLPGQGFDWVKVNKNQTTVFFQGQFKNYTPYQVSVFTVSHSSEVRHLSSVIGYSRQRTPSSAPLFQVLSIAETHVTLLWEPVPLCKQHGEILYYEIGVDKQNVYKVSAPPQHENQTFELPHLSPEQEYEVWIRAVNEAGPGENTTKRFNAKQSEYYAYLSVPIIVAFVLLICIIFICSCRGENKACSLWSLCDKVPDPRNSHIFREMKHQINDSIGWICIPVNEPHPEISLLEIVEIQPWASKCSLEKTSNTDRLMRPVVGDGSSQMNCQDDQRDDTVTEKCPRTDHKYAREAYSRMVDSDEERDGEEQEDKGDGWSSSEEEQCTSGYEKHFMPTTAEILEVS